MPRKDPGRVLLVDDIPEFRYVIAEQIRTFGYQVFEADDGNNALEVLSTEPGPWLALITDYRMPNLSGAELVRKVIANGIRFQVIILLSSLADEDDIERLKGELAGVTPFFFFDKPPSMEEIRLILDQLCVGQTGTNG